MPTHMFIIHPLYVCTTPGVKTPQYIPILLCASVCSQEASACCGGCRGPLTCWMPPPCMAGASPYALHLPLIGWLPCSPVCFGDIYMCYGEYSPYVWALGVFPHMLGVWGASAPLGVHMLHLVPSCSSLCLIPTMAMTTTPPVTVVSSGLSSVSSVTKAPSLMGLPAALSQCEVVLPPPLIPRGSGGVIGLASVPQLQPLSSMPLLAYANYPMGSPWGGFFFRAEPPTVLYIICLVSILVSAFYFQVPGWLP